MRVTGTVLCIPWPSTVPVYLSHWTYKSRPLTSAATSDLNMDPRVRKDQKAATSDLNIFIACSQECRRIKNKFWQPTSSLQHLHVQSEMTYAILNDILNEIPYLWFNCLRVKPCTLFLWMPYNITSSCLPSSIAYTILFYSLKQSWLNYVLYSITYIDTVSHVVVFSII